MNETTEVVIRTTFEHHETTDPEGEFDLLTERLEETDAPIEVDSIEIDESLGGDAVGRIKKEISSTIEEAGDMQDNDSAQGVLTDFVVWAFGMGGIMTGMEPDAAAGIANWLRSEYDIDDEGWHRALRRVHFPREDAPTEGASAYRGPANVVMQFFVSELMYEAAGVEPKLEPYIQGEK